MSPATAGGLLGYTHPMQIRFFLLPLLVLSSGCEARSSALDSAGSAPPPASSSTGTQAFGAPLAKAKTIPLSEVLAEADRYKDKNVTVEGKVRRNCTRKGCWMELADDSSENGPGCRVTFKDYAFFVPLDSAGATARVEGVVHSQVISASEVEHMESEGATFASKQPDGTAREIRIVASGVELTRS